MSLDQTLKTIAPIAEHLDLAETAVAEENWATVRIELDHVDVGLDELRAAYRDADVHERPLLAKMASPLRARRDAVAGALPALTTVSEGSAEMDPDEEVEPE